MANLASNTSCYLQRFNSLSPDILGTEVRVYSSQFCIPALTNNFCSSYNEVSPLCLALRGTPLVCPGSNNFAGFVIGGGVCEEFAEGRYLLRYLSGGQFQEWINEVSGSKLSSKISGFVIAITLLISLKNIL